MIIKYVERRTGWPRQLEVNVLETIQPDPAARINIGYRLCSMANDPDIHLRVFDSKEIQIIDDGTILGHWY